MMGTSVLAMPWAFAEAGLAAAILLCLINGPVAAFTAILVDRLHKKASISTLHQDDSLSHCTLYFRFQKLPIYSFHFRRQCRRICACVQVLRRLRAQILSQHRVVRSCNRCGYCLPHIDLQLSTFHRKLFLLWVRNVRRVDVKVCIKSPWTVVWFSQIVYFISDYQRLCKQLPKLVKLQKLYSMMSCLMNVD